jgi:hypothetical protein
MLLSEIEVHLVPDAAMHDDSIIVLLMGVGEVETSMTFITIDPNDILIVCCISP